MTTTTTTRPAHDPNCDCWRDEVTGRRLERRACLDCGDELAATDGCRCLAHDTGRCMWCGLDDECSIPYAGPAKGDRVCLHCAAGHQRVRHFADGPAAVHGPCVCELPVCTACGLEFDSVRADGSTVAEGFDSYHCTRCAPGRCECCCDTEEEHNAGIERSRLEFLADPGPAPAHWDAATTARVTAAVAAERAKIDTKG